MGARLVPRRWSPRPSGIGVWTCRGGKHQVRAIVQLKTKGIDIVGRTQEDFNEYRNRQKFLLKTRDLITRTINEPAVASLETVKNAENPVQMVEDSLRVAVVTDDILEVTMTGNNIEDMKVILDHLVKRYVDDATGSTCAARRQKKKLAPAESMRVEIDAAGQEHRVIGRANQTIGGQTVPCASGVGDPAHRGGREYNRPGAMDR